MSRGDMWGAPPPSGGPGHPGSSAGYPGPPPGRTTNVLAVISLVLSFLWLLWLGSLAAVVLGFIALRQIKRSAGWRRGRTPAIIGVVAGLLGLVILAVSIAGLAAYHSSSGSGHTAGGPAATSAPAAAPVHAGSSTAQVSVAGTGYTQTTNGAGDLISYGVILRNHSSRLAALRVRLTVTLLDSRGRSVATQTVTITGIPANGRFYVGGIAAPNVSLTVSSLHTAVDVGSSTPHKLALPPVTKATVTPGSLGVSGVAGDFRNPYTTLISSSATIYLVYLNAQGAIVGGDSEPAGAAVRPGQTVSFNDPASSLSFVKAASVKASVDPCGFFGQVALGKCPATP